MMASGQGMSEDPQVVSLDLMLCGAIVRAEVEPDLGEVLRRYYAPALVEQQGRVDVEVRVGSDVRAISGVPERTWSGRPPALQFEIALVDLIFRLNEGARIIHAGFVIYNGHPIVFTAPSGSGKSTMTREALRAGAEYVSDDLICVSDQRVRGFARAIRLSPIPTDQEPIPHYLQDSYLDGFGLRETNRRMLTPIWWNGGPVRHSYELGNRPVVVVRVSRGADEVKALSPVERLVVLHEQSIVRAGEYDGCLGDGPTFALSWEDPKKAFELLAEQLEAL